MHSFLDYIFAEFRFYRRLKGGTWYKVTDKDEASGMRGAALYWTRSVRAGWEVIKTEVSPLKNCR